MQKANNNWQRASRWSAYFDVKRFTILLKSQTVSPQSCAALFSTQ